MPAIARALLPNLQRSDSNRSGSSRYPAAPSCLLEEAAYAIC